MQARLDDLAALTATLETARAAIHENENLKKQLELEKEEKGAALARVGELEGSARMLKKRNEELEQMVGAHKVQEAHLEKRAADREKKIALLERQADSLGEEVQDLAKVQDEHRQKFQDLAKVLQEATETAKGMAMETVAVSGQTVGDGNGTPLGGLLDGNGDFDDGATSSAPFDFGGSSDSPEDEGCFYCENGIDHPYPELEHEPEYYHPSYLDELKFSMCKHYKPEHTTGKVGGSC